MAECFPLSVIVAVLQLPITIDDSVLPLLKKASRSRISVIRINNGLESDSPLPRIAMISTHGYVAALPPLGAADTGGQVVYVLELARKLALLGYQVDIWTRRFEEQSEIEPVAERVRIIRMPCGGKEFRPKEYLCDSLPAWNEHALRFIKRHGLNYNFIDSHYWDAGLAAQHLCTAMNESEGRILADLTAPMSLDDAEWDEPWDDGD